MMQEAEATVENLETRISLLQTKLSFQDDPSRQEDLYNLRICLVLESWFCDSRFEIESWIESESNPNSNRIRIESEWNPKQIESEANPSRIASESNPNLI